MNATNIFNRRSKKVKMKSKYRSIGLLLYGVVLLSVSTPASAQIRYNMSLAIAHASYFSYDELSNAHFIVIKDAHTPHWKYCTKMPIMLNFYALNDSDSLPGKQLNDTTIIIYNPSGDDKIVVNLQQYNIDFPKTGCFIALEAFRPSWYIKHKYISSRESSYYVKDKITNPDGSHTVFRGEVFVLPQVKGFRNRKHNVSTYKRTATSWEKIGTTKFRIAKLK